MYRDNTNFIKTYNQYKIPQEVIDIADVILSKDENPTVVVPSQFYSYIRQYSSSIKLLYGRDSEGYVQLSDGDALTLSNLVSDNNNSDSPTVARLLRNNQCKFFVVSNDDFSDIVNYGFEILCSIDGYTIYHDVQNFNEYTLHIIKGENNAFLSLTDIYKRLAIIDGGAINNYNIIKQYILDNGQSVNQWLITNTNSNYSGSAIKVLDSDNNIKVGNLYAANVISTRYKDYVNQNSINLWPYDSICYYQTLDWLFRPVLANDNIQLLDTNTQILNTYTDSDTNGNLILNGSVIFKFGNEYNDSFLYVSDITSEQLEDMFSKYSTEELSAKYLIINNSEISDYSDLIDEVHPQKVYDLKENIPIDINLHINK